jgi:hypothetical protein
MRPSIDRLEDKALLSNLAVGLIAHQPLLQAEVQRADPMRVVVDHRVVQHSALQAAAQPPLSTQATWMALSMWTDQTTYNVGQTVHMYLTITNNSNTDHTVALGPSIDAFLITQNGNVIWQSNTGAQPQYIVNQTLAPGQSVTLSSQCTMWTTGTFVVSNQMCPEGPFATFTVTAGTPNSQPPQY